MGLPQEPPFYKGDGKGLLPEQFVGRSSLKKIFREFVGYTEDVNVLPPSTESHWAWIIEGGRAYGKSAFAAWCKALPGGQDVKRADIIVVSVEAPGADLGDAFGELLRAIESEAGAALQGRRKAWNADISAPQNIVNRILYLSHMPGRWLVVAINAVSSYVGIGSVVSQRDAKSNSKEVLERVRKIGAGVRGLQQIVIIVDGVSELPRVGGSALGPVENGVAGLISDLYRMSGNGGGPRIGLVALAYPGFVDRIPVERKSRYARRTALQPFSRTDTTALAEVCLGSLVDHNVALAWGDWLHTASGGIPDLAQVIGYNAYVRERTARGKLTESGIRDFVVAPDEETVGRLRHQLEWKGIMPRVLKEYGSAILSSVKRPLERKRAVCISAEEWQSGMKRKAITTTAEQVAEVEALWKLFVEHEVVVPCQTQEGITGYRFIAEAVRVSLEACANGD